MPKTLIEHCQPISSSSLELGNMDISSIQINGQLVNVTVTQCNYGGVRIWFICPSCQKRVGKLFRKPLTNIFACRVCNDLAYLSTRIRRSFIEEDIKTMKQLISR